MFWQKVLEDLKWNAEGWRKSYSHANMKEKMQWLKESLSAYRLAVCLLPSGLQLKKYFKFRHIIRLGEIKWERETQIGNGIQVFSGSYLVFCSNKIPIHPFFMLKCHEDTSLSRKKNQQRNLYHQHVIDWFIYMELHVLHCNSSAFQSQCATLLRKMHLKYGFIEVSKSISLDN